MDHMLSPTPQQDNRSISTSHKRTASSSSHLIPPVTTHRKQSIDDDELNKNISLEYQDIQIRTLTKWMNVQLNQVGDSIDSIIDLKDGKKLLKLLSVVANQPQLIPEKGNMLIHQLSNVSKALKFLQEQWGIDSLPAIASEAIVSGNVKSTLALAFFIMLKYQIHPILLNPSFDQINPKLPPPSPLPTVSSSRLSGAKPLAEAKSALLYWVRSQLEDYVANQIIYVIQDFSRSWRSGLAFCLLIHRHDPELLPTLFKEHIPQIADKDTWYTVLSLAFDVAEKYMQVPKYLEPADLLIEYPHEPSVMMYVSEVYKVMSKQQIETTEHRQKRLEDISILCPEKDQLTLAHRVHEEDTVEHQLDLLASLIEDPASSMEHITRLLADIPTRLPAEHHVRFHQLKEDWEKRTQLRIDPFLIKLRDMMPKDDHHELLHPLDGTIEMANRFEQSLSLLTDEYQLSNQDSYVASIIEATSQACQQFRHGATFGQITSAINDELDVIQKLMADRESSKVTDELIQSLEQRIHLVSATIQGVRDQYEHLLFVSDKDPFYARFIQRMDQLEERYQIVRDWVDQVRVWFVEAERIRAWIDHHIQVIEERNRQSELIEPTSHDIPVPESQVVELHEAHERLKQEIDHFDSDDMDRLRAHVKMLTHSSESEKELTPADTSTIEITLTTLNRLSHLTKLLENRSHWIQLLLLRVKWEKAFRLSVQWIAETESELDDFLKMARWSEKEEENYRPRLTNNATEEEDDSQEQSGVEKIINKLVQLETKIAEMDRGAYTEVLEAYQEMESLTSLPDYLEARQLGFEKAFEDLMKRSGFSRKIVEQLLSMISTMDKFKELRDVGEQLRHELLQDTSLSSRQTMEEEDVYAERAQAFKEESARLITNASTCIPYPVAPEMSTAIGAQDAHENEMTNENIHSAISSYSMSLALIADGLDQLLMSRYQAMSLQQRTSEAFESMVRFKVWMDERIRLLKKPRFDVMLYNASSSTSSSSSSGSSHSSEIADNSLGGTLPPGSSHSTSTATTSPMDDEHLLLLEKERDGIASRLDQMEQDELIRLFDSVRALEQDIDASNAVSIDRSALINGLESLQESHQELKELVALRDTQLEALKRRLQWESQWTKSNNHLQTIARKLCDFSTKKARYDPSKENVEKPSYDNDHDIIQSLQFLQDRVAELGERHLNGLDESFQELVSSYNKLPLKHLNGNLTVIVGVPDSISNRQSDLRIKYDDLRLLTSYTSDLVAQRSSLTEFLIRSLDARHEGEKIKELVHKRTRRIMATEDEESGVSLDARVAEFKQEIKQIWEDCGKNMPYPVYNGNWLKSSPNQQSTSDSNSTYRSQVRAQIKSLIDKKMDDLHALEKEIDQCLTSYHDADRIKTLVHQYEQEACELGRWIDEQIDLLRQQHIDVSAESFLARGMNISDLKKARLDMWMQAESFESDKVKLLHDRIAQLVQESVEKKKHRSIDISQAARQLGEVMEHLSELKRGLADQAITLEAASMRDQWEKDLQKGITKLEEMNGHLRKFNAKKNALIAQDELSEDDVISLQQDLNKLMSQKTKFEKHVMPSIQTSYEAFVEYFPKLSRPMATPDHLEARMESLGRTASRFQESVEARSKELDLIKQRMRWEDIVKQALHFLSGKETLIQVFIEEKARWHDDISINSNEDEESSLRTEWSAIYSDVKQYEENQIKSIEKRYDQLLLDSNDYYSNNSSTLLPSVVSKKMQDLKLSQERANYFLSFSNEVITQRCLVSAFILRTAQLEQSAELIREEFIATKIAGGGAHIIGLFESHAERLEKFKASIDDVRLNLANSIPFPVRSLDNGTTQAKIKDETINSVIHEAICLRTTRLEELWSSLQQILESKERISRRRLTLHAFDKQAILVRDWIDTRLDMLDQSHLAKGNTDIDKAKEAVRQADSVEKAMQSNATVMSSLTVAFDKCVAAFEDDSLSMEDLEEQNDGDSSTDRLDVSVKPTHKQLVQAWDDLLSNAVEANKHRTAHLIQLKIDSWLSSLNSLSMRIEKETKEATASNDKVALWMDELDQLESKEYQALLVDVASKAYDQALLEPGKLKMGAIRAQLHSLQNELHLSQLIEKYMLDITRLENMMAEQMACLDRVREEHSLIADEATPEHREHQHQALVSKYKHASDTMADIKDILSDVSGEYEAIISQTADYPNNYAKLNDTWHSLTNKESSISALVARSSKWTKNYNLLTSVQKSLEAIQSELANESPQTHVKINDELSRMEAMLHKDLVDLDDDLLKDTINIKAFNTRRAVSVELLVQLKGLLHHQVSEKEKMELIMAIKRVVDRLLSVCQQQLALAVKHSENCRVLNESKSDMKSIIESCTHLINTTGEIYDQSQSELELIRIQEGDKLLKQLEYPLEQLNALFDPIASKLSELDSVTKSEEEYISVVKSMLEYVENKSYLLNSVNACFTKLDNIEVSEEVVFEFEAQLSSFDEGAQDLYKLGNSVKSCPISHLMHAEARMKHISPIIEKGNDAVTQDLSKLRQSLIEVRESIDRHNYLQHLLARLHDAIQFVADTTDRVDSFELTHRGMASKAHDLQELCDDYYEMIDKKTKAVDTSMRDYTTNDQVKGLRGELSDAMHKLDVLIDTKKKEACHEGDLSGFLNMIRTAEKHISSLQTVIESASPHHSGIVNNKFVKTDLQALLKSLVTAFKRHQQMIGKIFEEARVELNKQGSDENDDASHKLQKSIKRWNHTKAAAAARERELQTCIDQLSHEFFTKLAIAKATPHTTAKTLYPTPTLSKKNISSASSNSKILNLSVNRREEPSYRRPSKTPISASSSTSRLRTTYVPDPENELDIKLGHIVNTSPYRVTVKSIPDQVGKYWFGDVNPKLVYCRILASQLVMVRVGGGWVELSKFLRDHGLNEGIYSRPDSANDSTGPTSQENGSFQEAFLQTVRSSSPSGRVTIRGGGGAEKNSNSLVSTRSSSRSSGGSRSRSPMPGYVDGSNYISVDELGNHIIVKMKKADDHAKTPVINKKKLLQAQ
ncbi:hypothetical protein BD560DRAFT_401339 [Blakeslea trispora]|nr:hypothetical protein BD560DRAFT_401339 [Blakeslea trispora]